MRKSKQLLIAGLIGFVALCVVVIITQVIPGPIEPVGARGMIRDGRFWPTASGLYLGKGIVLTAWHVSAGTYSLLSHGFDIPDEMELLRYVKGQTDETIANNWFCPVAPETDLFASPSRVYQISATDMGNCVPQKNIYGRYFRLSQRGLLANVPVVPVIDLLYANRDVEISVIKVDDRALRSLNIPRVCVTARQVNVGEHLLVVGHPLHTYPALKTEVVVVDAAPRMLTDPDPNIPEQYRYAAMTIKVRPKGNGRNPITYGSSGSPVFDAQGMVVGLVWTGENFDGNGPSWVTPASVWWPLLREANITDEDFQAIVNTPCE